MPGGNVSTGKRRRQRLLTRDPLRRIQRELVLRVEEGV
jgi:hypothetical protein